MARPTKTPADRLTKTARFRVTEAEQLQLEQLAAGAGQSVSDYVRGLVLQSKPRRIQATTEQRTLITGLGMLGNIRSDINQLVKDRQAHHFVKPETAEAALQAVSTLADLIIAELAPDGH